MKYKLLSAIIATNLLAACGGGSESTNKEPVKIEENAPPTVEVQSILTLNENSSKTINFSISDPENDPTQVNIESNDTNFSATIQGNSIVIESNEITENITGSFYIVASDNKNTTKQKVDVNILDSNTPSFINFPEQITLNEDPSKTFELTFNDLDSETLSISFDYNKDDFSIDYDITKNSLKIDYIGNDITETVKKQFDILVNDGINSIIKVVFITIYPTNNTPVIEFDNDITLSEGAIKFYKLDINDDNIGKVTYQFNTEVNGLSFSIVENNRMIGFNEDYANTEYSQYLIVDATSIDIFNDINSYLEIIVKDTFEGLDEIIETKIVDLNLLDKMAIENLTFNSDTDIGISIPTIKGQDSFNFTIDLMKQANPWTTHCFSNECSDDGNTNESASLDLDDKGWVRTLPEASDSPKYTHVKTTVFNNTNEARKTKRFFVLFEGSGKITYDIEGRKNTQLSQPFMDVIDLDKYDSIFTLNIEKDYEDDNTSDYIRNVKVIPDAGYCDNLYTFSIKEDCNGKFVHFLDVEHYFDFHPDLINSLKDYKTLNLTNNLKVSNNNYFNSNDFFFNDTNERSWLSEAHGLPFSKLVELASLINADISIDIPVNATFTGFSNNLISSLSNFENTVHISYGNINENFSESEPEPQYLFLNQYNELSNFEEIVSQRRRTKLTEEINNDNSLTEEEKTILLADLDKEIMIPTEEKILNIIAKINNDYCKNIRDNSTLDFTCNIRGSFNNEIINVIDYTYNEALLNCDIYREYLKTQPDTTDNINYWTDNNCDVLFDSVIIEPVLGDYIENSDMQTIGNWGLQLENELFVNFNLELNVTSTFTESGDSALSTFENKITNTFNNLSNYDVNIIGHNARHNYYIEGESGKEISNYRKNIIKMNNTVENDIWKDAYQTFLQTWIDKGGNSLILFNSVESNEDYGVRSLQSNEDQNSHQKRAVEDILSENGCWICK
jgi:hypothetical protein